jgi:hypothetical protein
VTARVEEHDVKPEEHPEGVDAAAARDEEGSVAAPARQRESEQPGAPAPGDVKIAIAWERPDIEAPNGHAFLRLERADPRPTDLRAPGPDQPGLHSSLTPT